jgi:hypothetical protein
MSRPIDRPLALRLGKDKHSFPLMNNYCWDSFLSVRIAAIVSKAVSRVIAIVLSPSKQIGITFIGYPQNTRRRGVCHNALFHFKG